MEDLQYSASLERAGAADDLQNATYLYSFHAALCNRTDFISAVDTLTKPKG
jgi:hypothetical protein